MKTVGERIKFLRKQEGLNQIEFSKKMHLSQGRLSEIEKGNSKPSFETLESLKNIYNVSIDWLISGEYYDKSIEQTNSINIRCGLGELSNKEQEILHLFRQLTPIQRERFIGRLEGLLDTLAINNE